MIKQLGYPDILLTLSVADNRLPLIKHFYESLNVCTDSKTLFKLNSENPKLQTLFNIRILEAYMKNFINHILPMKDMFNSFEFQGRGSLHSHILIWFDENLVILFLKI